MPLRLNVSIETVTKPMIKIITATSGQVDFTIDKLFIPGQNQVEVYINGLYQYAGIDFVEISNTAIRTNTPCNADDEVLIRVGVK